MSNFFLKHRSFAVRCTRYVLLSTVDLVYQTVRA